MPDRRAGGARREREIEAAVGEQGGDIAAEDLSCLHLEVGERPVECRVQFGKGLICRGHRVGDAQLADLSLGGGPGALDQALGRVEDAFGLAQEDFASRGGGHRPRGPSEQAYAEHALGGLDLLADRLLRHVEFVCGSGEAAGLGDLDEVAHLAQVRSGRVVRPGGVGVHSTIPQGELVQDNPDRCMPSELNDCRINIPR
jgi:hypothetical protein